MQAPARLMECLYSIEFYDLHPNGAEEVSSGECGIILRSIQCRNTAFLIDYEFGEVEI